MSWVHHLGWFAPLLFLIIYCFATIMFLPTMVITLAGGALFGPFFGTLLNLIGATSGAAFSFLITRHLVYNWFSQRKGKRLKKLISAVEQKGWLIVAVLRLFPIIPFNIVNYGLGLTGIGFRSYLITTFIFLVPAEIIYTYFGYAGMEALLQQGAFYKNKEILIAGLAILVLCFIKILHLNNFRFRYSKKKIID
ncbi:TVP38/TMEM64 family protein [Fluoribacter dumoffii]|nr:TVP38/TMEM64 family protein [Fluoribacter dumoffii]MCW8386546.1 TVP38/TMEM64 family protein [Fluoribacter dumoffii]MCW8419600.1 TVP38/TMEM64 family protein [Fluoribacter dumoffii]MCW8455697.1 TVP38/TMEM64 family protein [Fluoribacter dumoffii]MCW8460224.1 TVP38/TMEM64 family protein [Fluoribacter dumoffii]MCW8483703.1 TVP38/TMEM64 family protein [Fluoribacter dumoffii]